MCYCENIGFSQLGITPPDLCAHQRYSCAKENRAKPGNL